MKYKLYTVFYIISLFYIGLHCLNSRILKSTTRPRQGVPIFLGGDNSMKM